MKQSIQQKQQKVTEGILNAFRSKFGSEEEPINFDTCWPLAKWDLIHTKNRTFTVELNLTSGKVINIQEEF